MLLVSLLSSCRNRGNLNSACRGYWGKRLSVGKGILITIPTLFPSVLCFPIDLGTKSFSRLSAWGITAEFSFIAVFELILSWIPDHNTCHPSIWFDGDEGYWEFEYMNLWIQTSINVFLSFQNSTLEIWYFENHLKFFNKLSIGSFSGS